MLNPLSLINSSPYALAIKVGAIVLAAGLMFSVGAYAGYRWEHGALLQLQLADAQEQTKAVSIALDIQKKQDATSLDAAVSEAKAQVKIVTIHDTITKEIPAHVTPVQNARTCITVGLARVMRAAAEGTDASSLQLAAGQSDDDCSDVTATEMASWFNDYAAASRGNAQQLNDLEGTVLKLIQENNGATP